MSERPGSNRRHSAWKADALPTELLSRVLVSGCKYTMFFDSCNYFFKINKTFYHHVILLESENHKCYILRCNRIYEIAGCLHMHLIQ